MEETAVIDARARSGMYRQQRAGYDWIAFWREMPGNESE